MDLGFADATVAVNGGTAGMGRAAALASPRTARRSRCWRASQAG